MARQSNIKLVITIGNLIFYQRLGDFYIRTKPVAVKQTKATKKAGNNFGKANRVEKAIRNSLHAIIPNIKDKQMMRRLAKAVYCWLNTDSLQTKEKIDHLPFISDYEYNEQSLLVDKWQVALQVTRPTQGTVALHIAAFNPAIDIAAPAGTKTVICTIIVTACNMDTAAITGSYATQLSITYEDATIPAQDILSDISTSAGCLMVVAVALQYNTGTSAKENIVSNMRWLPAGIVDAMYD